MSLWSAAGATLLAGCETDDTPAPAASGSEPTPEGAVADGNEALERLKVGNWRFAQSKDTSLHEGRARREEVAAGQRPFATILSCVDSRVPPEMIFDRGLGDLVVVRSAGGVLDRAVLGSIEFGVAELKTPLVVVLGHEKCGAVQAALDAAKNPGKPEGSIGYLLSAIRPAINPGADNPLDNAIKVNVALIRDQLRKSPVLSHHKGLVVAGGYYHLKSGIVQYI